MFSGLGVSGLSLLVAIALIASACAGGASTTLAPVNTDVKTEQPATTEAPAASTSPLPAVGPSTVTSPEKVDSMKISITLEGKVITATLIDSKTTQDFISLLPLTLTLTDYAGTEKVSDLPKRLSTEDAPAGSDPSVGDIAYYAPWGNLAIYYRDFGYSSGLVTLAQIDGGIEALRVPGPVRVTFELVN